MASFTETDGEFLRAWVRDHTGVIIRPDQQYLLDSRLGPLAVSHNMTTAELAAAIRAGRQPISGEALDATLNNETSWFRDPAAFDTLRDHLIPAAVEANRARRQLSIWSAAASGGQELYSVAMLLAEHFPEVFTSWHLRLVGTDVSKKMIGKARAGRYSQAEVSRGLSGRYLVEYFERERLDWVVDEKLRRKVHFEERSILNSPPGMFDIVLCRYLLIYFDDQTKSRALTNVAGALAPKGVLMLGGSEMFVPKTNEFTTRTVGRSIVYVPNR